MIIRQLASNSRAEIDYLYDSAGRNWRSVYPGKTISHDFDPNTGELIRTSDGTWGYRYDYSNGLLVSTEIGDGTTSWTSTLTYGEMFRTTTRE